MQRYAAKYHKLQNTDITLSAVTLGCMTFTGDSSWGSQDEKDSIDPLRIACHETPVLWQVSSFMSG